MASREVVIASAVGLHARPAAVFVSAVAATGLPVTISKPGRMPVSARSILAVMTLNVRCGERITISAEGDGADEAVESLAALLASDLG